MNSGKFFQQKKNKRAKWFANSRKKETSSWMKTTGIAVGGLVTAAAGAAAYLQTENGKKAVKKVRKKGWGSLIQN
ncbi:hypothetical protein SAMN05444487_105177 [Marininema mesophilum]|uniref:Uncharacterized protein n=1 Tax=Marininema mesophilum TaxID=1048340 RepID=A0A1H2VRD6_9BACL|nr:hypothetical protein [Marininema mesophilum]SDW70534.1 hypothetical protein SAMN05444487_105177 [Marininema mesophilum]